jgi:hypothetical protein
MNSKVVFLGVLRGPKHEFCVDPPSTLSPRGSLPYDPDQARRRNVVGVSYHLIPEGAMGGITKP